MFLVPSRGTNVLKSVSMGMCIPKMYVDNFSPAHVFASASFSV